MTDIDTTHSIEDWIRQGAHDEDDTLSTNFFRYRNHFYDPQHGGAGYSYVGVEAGEPSPDWALEDTRTFITQSYSLKEARQDFYDALTLPSKGSREQWMARTFYTLGHVIHHTEDMAQPQHTRNDSHGGFFLGPPSLYEKYTDRPAIRSNLPFGGYGLVTFTKARDFWTGDGKGIAEFSSDNFVTTGTNFDKQPGQKGYFDSPRPMPGPPAATSLLTLLQADGTCPLPAGGGNGDCGLECTGLPPDPTTLAPACALQGDVLFYGSLVQDNYIGGAPVPNPRASTLSLFDQDLAAYDKQAEYRLENGQVVAVKKVFALNRFNFQAAYPFLIPKAVAYSAGLIDYFFRGRLEVDDVSDDDTGITLTVKKITEVKYT